MMHGHEESDSVIVAAKPANKVAHPAVEQSAAEPATAEPLEPRAETKGNADQQSTCRAQSRVSVSQALERIRQVAKERKKERFTALFHHISIDLLDEAFFELKQDAAARVDDLTWQDYQANATLRTCTNESNGERIGHCRHGERTYPSRMAGSAHSRSRLWRTKSSSGRRSRCSTRSTRKTSSGSRMDSDPGGARMMRWTRSLSGSTARK